VQPAVVIPVNSPMDQYTLVVHEFRFILEPAKASRKEESRLDPFTLEGSIYHQAIQYSMSCGSYDRICYSNTCE
jgi:hypothetical protein